MIGTCMAAFIEDWFCRDYANLTNFKISEMIFPVSFAVAGPKELCNVRNYNYKRHLMLPLPSHGPFNGIQIKNARSSDEVAQNTNVHSVITHDVQPSSYLKPSRTVETPGSITANPSGGQLDQS